MSLSVNEIIFRLIFATLVSGIIGWDREQRNHPAGIRTHILVCLGACLLGLIQQEICIQVLQMTVFNSHYLSLLRVDPARLICQVVSGIGFLGAGTIVITRHAVTGLTTAASLWATACLGIAIGMGYYPIAITGSILVIIVVILLNRLLKVKRTRQIEIKYYHREQTSNYLRRYFHKNHVQVEHYSFHINKDDMDGNDRIYTTIYTLKLPKSVSYAQMLDQLSANTNIVQINLVTL